MKFSIQNTATKKLHISPVPQSKIKNSNCQNYGLGILRLFFSEYKKGLVLFIIENTNLTAQVIFYVFDTAFHQLDFRTILFSLNNLEDDVL